MKRLFLVACAATMLLSSCNFTNGKLGKVSLKNAEDSLSYSIGMARSNGLVPYLSAQMGVDTTYMADFIRGFLDGAKMKDGDGAQNAYYAGIQIGQQEMSDAFVALSHNIFGVEDKLMNRDDYMNGFLDGVKESSKYMTREMADKIADSLYLYFHSQTLEIQYGPNRQAGIEYLQKKATEPGIIATGSGLLYRVIKEGKGAKPNADDVVSVNYRGSLIDGTVFDESKKPIELSLGGVIAGWTEALQLMSVGSKYELFIPYELAYGDSNNGQIKPYSALIFEVELVSIEK